ncbi:2Fe-2S iron-sulfur cluster-binding protein [Castellaniella defragrans]|jgi:CDP-4-dehydro-6-deoxyglucose reductase|uniref:2-polyprenylphenol hydroxylase n=2 Tax=Castellaniella defragrans TaxID=75697 RepID=W8X8F4_CASD6|nr:2Fe-2S iron-sulfur cluster-binding protein [Castellaniella defragrans]KAB0618294.1 2Fe-2S iron-sulfur cluster binding domain-containing protein [Castellaniella defragrans]MBB6082080.1 CDP-4-dehydro-6-deoxyglucose reductase [Castellaniella defragrans]CDM22980.1 2-polyprenylphenol hydroxylase [Castellaniella defragrans 65Phen]
MARIVIQPSGKTVECKGSDTVLMALEKAGYALPNNCRAGACGECKVKVLEGQYDQGMVLDMALTAEERRQGYGLMCMAKPLSEEMVIEWGTADALPKLIPPRENALFVLIDRREVASRTLELRLRPVGQPIRYWPGQYVTLGDERSGIPRRAYSIANAPRPDGEIILQVARADDGVTSSWIHDTLKVGDSVKLNGAYGTFTGDPSAETPVLCLAAGTGLAPIMDLAEAALGRGYRKRVDMIFSARTEADVYGQGMMAWWRTKHRNFDYKITLTRERKEGYLHGRITSILPGLYPDLSAHSVFIAGGTAFVDDCVAAVKALGAQDRLIHKEGFFTIQNARAEGR